VCLDFEVRCVGDRVWIQKNLISLLATTITRNDPAVRSLCARSKSAIRGGVKKPPYAPLIGQITRQEMRMLRD
jgi:hypothetical protein